MFTDIVSDQGQVSNISKHKGFLSLRIKTSEKFQKGLIGGASGSVNGVCLTFKKKVGKNIEFDVIEETLNLTNLGKLKLRSMVNLERSMKSFGNPIYSHSGNWAGRNLNVRHLFSLAI